MKLPEDLLDLLRQASPCYVATSMAAGRPQLTQARVCLGQPPANVREIDRHNCRQMVLAVIEHQRLATSDSCATFARVLRTATRSKADPAAA